MSDRSDDRFLARWSRRKALSREGVVPPEPAREPGPVVPIVEVPAADPPAQAAPFSPAEAPPTLADVAALAPGADIRRFVAAGVDAGVRNAALKKLFADPHFNVMDGLDTYIDDYNRPSVVPAAMLRRLMQARMPDPADDADPTPTPPSPAPLHEDPDLRLQPHDGTGSPGADPGAGADAGRER